MGYRHRVGQLVLYPLGAVGAASVLVLFTPLANLVAMPLYDVEETPRHADVIVVLAGWWNSEGSLNEASLTRTMVGIHLYRDGLAPYMLFAGGPCCYRSVSSAMADLAVELGVPRSAILLEEQSLRTHESATNSARLLRERGLQSALLVSSPLHLLRARLAFRAAGVRVFPVYGSRREVWEISGAADRLLLFEEAIHEYAGLAFYRLRGWI